MSDGRLLRVLELVGRNWWHYWFLVTLMIAVSLGAAGVRSGAPSATGASVTAALLLGGLVFCLFGAALGEIDTAIGKVRRDGGAWEERK